MGVCFLQRLPLPQKRYAIRSIGFDRMAALYLSIGAALRPAPKVDPTKPLTAQVRP